MVIFLCVFCTGTILLWIGWFIIYVVFDKDDKSDSLTSQDKNVIVMDDSILVFE